MKVEMWVEGEETGMESSANLISSLSSNPNQPNPFSLPPFRHCHPYYSTHPPIQTDGHAPISALALLK